MKKIIYPWFKKEWDKLSLLPKKKFPHALIVTGLSGIGKQDFCHLLIQSLLCEELYKKTGEQHSGSLVEDLPLDESLPCGVCPSCRQVQAGSHGDFLTLEIREGKKSIGVDQIREMINWINLTHQSKQKKVLFIPAADKMTLQASNALLKTLEEPPGEVVILLLVDHLKSLIATVRSRCQIVSLAKPDKQVIRQWLEESYPDWEINSAVDSSFQSNHSLLLSLAFYTPLKVKQLLTSNELSQRKKIIEQLFLIIENNKAPVLASGELSKIEIQQIIYWLQAIIFDLIYIHFNVDNEKLINQDYFQQLSTISPRLNSLLLFELLKELNQYYQFQGTAINLQLLLDSYLIKWRNCINVL